MIYRPGKEVVAVDAISRRPRSDGILIGAALIKPPYAMEMRAEQAKDPTCMDILQKLSDGHTRTCHGFITDIDGVLYSLAHHYGMPTLRPVVPLSLSQRVLQCVHAAVGQVYHSYVSVTVLVTLF